MSADGTRKTKKRGRPHKHGYMEGWTIARIGAVLKAYDEARSRGEKYDTAVQEAIEYVRLWRPIMPISSGEVRRVLTFHRGKGTTEGWHFREIQANERDQFQVGEFGRVCEEPYTDQSRCLSMYFGPIPLYPRVNAKRPRAARPALGN